MLKFILLIIFLIFFLLAIKLVRLFGSYISVTRKTIDDLKEENNSIKKNYNDIEEAEFREIPPENDDNDKK